MGYEVVILLGTLYLLLKSVCRGVFCAGYLRAEVSHGHLEQHICSSRGLLLQGLNILQFQRKNVFFSDPLTKKPPKTPSFTFCFYFTYEKKTLKSKQ